jgi:hypothetical protein
MPSISSAQLRRIVSIKRRSGPVVFGAAALPVDAGVFCISRPPLSWHYPYQIPESEGKYVNGPIKK